MNALSCAWLLLKDTVTGFIDDEGLSRGAAIAYYAARRGARPVVIERHAVGGSASGKSGAFLALDWCRGSDLDRLARRSFQLHADLAAELDNPWSYRPLAPP
jgi:glycine/D-amino acid oxidase-like deaminating enzyme